VPERRSAKDAFRNEPAHRNPGWPTARNLKEDQWPMQAAIVLCRHHNFLLNLSNFRNAEDRPTVYHIERRNFRNAPIFTLEEL
jgi:hypothetical protein